MQLKLLSAILIITGPALYGQTANSQDTAAVSNVFESTLQEVVVTANREGVKRSEAPVAISSISSRIIRDTKAASIDQLLNKVSGVNMVNLGNEQHQMSIRQPMTTKSLFLYLDDGIPIRTSGLFNHNALLEINMANVKNIEVIKGPSSSMYGSEAIGGVVNFISPAPTEKPLLKLSVQGSGLGYRREEMQTSFTSGKWGIAAGGYHAAKRNSYLEFTDFHKSTFTARVDYRFSEQTSITNKITWLDYYSDMAGAIDSTMFANKVFTNPQTFTYRKVTGWRYQSTLTHRWNNYSKSTVSLVYRDNVISQNPAYRIKDDYQKKGNSWMGRKDVAHGEINNNGFSSYAFIAQHKQELNWKKSVLIAGVSTDISPSQYDARYIKIAKDTLSGKYVGYQASDSMLSDYSTKISNYASFINYEFSPAERLRIVASIRYDLFNYRFGNQLAASSFSGSPDTVNHFSSISSKIGFTYNFSTRTGIYANYSEGFIPPQVSEMYTGVKVPALEPVVATNYEVGAWAEIIKNVLFTDVSVYQLNSTNEIVSARLDDGSFANINAGKTTHKGIELGITAKPVKEVSIRWSGAYSRHRFVRYQEKGKMYDGNEMNAAPNWIYNTEVCYKPSFAPGLRLGAEVQHIGDYFTDAANTNRYKGFTTLNIRAGYEYKAIEFWVNALNITDTYYANIVTKNAYGYSYNLADPVNFTIGVSYDFGSLFTAK